MENIERSKVPLSSEELLVKLRQGKKTSEEIRMGGLTIPIRVLSCDEINSIRREANRIKASIQGDDTDRNLEIQKNTLKLASNVSGGIPFLGDKLLSMMTLDEITYLYDEFIRFMDSVNPSLDQITPEIFRSLIDALKKKIISPRELSLVHLRAICIAYVDLIQRQETVI